MKSKSPNNCVRHNIAQDDQMLNTDSKAACEEIRCDVRMKYIVVMQHT